LKGSPRKARLVIDLIRGRNVSQALAILKFTDKRAADPISKCLSSAIANATYLAEQQNIAIDPDDLWVRTCFVDMGPTKNRRRMRPAPQGRAYREQRHYCHITIQVSSDEQVVGKNISIKEKTGGEKKSKASGTSSNATKGRNPEMRAGTVKTDNTDKKEKAEDSIVDENVASSVIPNEESQSKKSTAPSKTGDGKNIADASDVKNVASQTPQERHENKPADPILDNNQSST
jgi:large subunit ribosomal protein L22